MGAALVAYGLTEAGCTNHLPLDRSEPSFHGLMYIEGRFGNTTVSKGLADLRLAENPEDTDALIVRIEQLVAEGNVSFLTSRSPSRATEFLRARRYRLVPRDAAPRVVELSIAPAGVRVSSMN